MVQTDCAPVAADNVLAMTGEDIAAPFRGKYSSPAEPARALKRSSVADLKATFDTLLPPKPIGYLTSSGSTIRSRPWTDGMAISRSQIRAGLRDKRSRTASALLSRGTSYGFSTSFPHRTAQHRRSNAAQAMEAINAEVKEYRSRPIPADLRRLLHKM